MLNYAIFTVEVTSECERNILEGVVNADKQSIETKNCMKALREPNAGCESMDHVSTAQKMNQESRKSKLIAR